MRLRLSLARGLTDRRNRVGSDPRALLQTEREDAGKHRQLSQNGSGFVQGGLMITPFREVRGRDLVDWLLGEGQRLELVVPVPTYSRVRSSGPDLHRPGLHQ